MRFYQYLTIAAIGIFAACQPKENKTAENNVSPATKQSCYSYTNNKDSATLTLITSGHVITGELSYKLFEKDSNHGVIKGAMRGDTLIADYVFNSEGKESTRQVAFLKKDGKLLEGYGEVTELQGKTRFSTISKLKFGGSIEFTEVTCQ